jgi:hypothetical protein
LGIDGDEVPARYGAGKWCHVHDAVLRDRTSQGNVLVHIMVMHAEGGEAEEEAEEDGEILALASPTSVPVGGQAAGAVESEPVVAAGSEAASTKGGWSDVAKAGEEGSEEPKGGAAEASKEAPWQATALQAGQADAEDGDRRLKTTPSKAEEGSRPSKSEDGLKTTPSKGEEAAGKGSTATVKKNPRKPIPFPGGGGGK